MYDDLSPAERRSRVATILAKAVVRVVSGRIHAADDRLDSSRDQSVHGRHDG